MAPEADDAPWEQYRNLVIQELERLDHTMKELTRKVDESLDRTRRDYDRRTDDLNRKIDTVLDKLRQEAEVRNSSVWQKFSQVEVSVAMLQVKSGGWGAVAGAALGGGGVVITLGALVPCRA